MKLKRNLLLLFLSLKVSIPTFALPISDTFLYDNAKYTFSNMWTDSKFIISSDNVLMASGAKIPGNSSANVNTGSNFVRINKNDSGLVMENIVCVTQALNEDYYFVDEDGVLYGVAFNQYPRVIELPEGFKCKRAAVVTYKDNGWPRFVYALSEDGRVYDVQKKQIIEGIESAVDIEVCSSIDTYAKAAVLIKTSDGIAHLLDSQGTIDKQSFLTNVKEIRSALRGFYVELDTGKLAYVTVNGVVSQVPLAKDEYVVSIATDNFSKIGDGMMVTNKSAYTLLTGNKYKKTIEIQEKGVIPIYLRGTIVLCSNGKYYTVTDSTSCLTFTEIPNTSDWINSNPIIRPKEISNIDIVSNSVVDRDDFEIKFSVITQNTPTAFNIYYAKFKDSHDKQSWKLIESNVKFSDLNPEGYDTNYKNSKGESIKGYTYTYKWKILDEENLNGISLIVEPLYD